MKRLQSQLKTIPSTAHNTPGHQFVSMALIQHPMKAEVNPPPLHYELLYIYL